MAGAVIRALQCIRDTAGARYEHLELNALVQRVEVTDHRSTLRLRNWRVRWPQLSAADILEGPYVLIGTVDRRSFRFSEAPGALGDVLLRDL